jgi:putative redox protein
MTATARRVGDTLRHEVDVNGRHVIVTDEPERLGGTDDGPAPHELMAAMLAACAATTIAMYAQTRGWEIGEVSVHADYDSDSAPRQITLQLRLPENLTDAQRGRLERVAASCPARRALETGFVFDERTVMTPAAPTRHVTAGVPRRGDVRGSSQTRDAGWKAMDVGSRAWPECSRSDGRGRSSRTIARCRRAASSTG